VLVLYSELNGQLIERVATEFNRLQFYVSKVRGLPLVDELKPVIIRDVLYFQILDTLLLLLMVVTLMQLFAFISTRLGCACVQ